MEILTISTILNSNVFFEIFYNVSNNFCENFDHFNTIFQEFHDFFWTFLVLFSTKI